MIEVVHPPVVDLFASAINKQMPQYVSWKPDPLAWAIDAFTISWKNLNFYAFPPFSIVPIVLQKLQQDQATGICILPNWPTQAWFPVMLQLLINHPYRASPHKRLLTLLPAPQEIHPLHKKLDLLVLHLSGDPSLTLQYQRQLRHSSRTPGELARGANMTQSCMSGDHFVLNDRPIPLYQL